MQKQILLRTLNSCKKTVLHTALHVLTSATFFFLPRQTNAQGNLLLNPGRVVFDGAKKTQELNLANSGTDTARYVISMTEIRMTTDGTFENITQPDSGQNFASAHVRFFPRSVTLAPNEAQSVKIQVTKPEELATGEYRSHLYFRAVPDARPLGEKEAPKDTSNISVHITPIFGISIPVIIRVGDCSAQVNFANASFKMANDTLPLLTLQLNRTGNMSVYGDIAVDYVSPQGKTTRVGMVNGIAVYTPTPSRLFRLKLNNMPGVNYQTGKLRVVYTTPANTKVTRLADTELALN